MWWERRKRAVFRMQCVCQPIQSGISRSGGWGSRERRCNTYSALFGTYTLLKTSVRLKCSRILLIGSDVVPVVWSLKDWRWTSVVQITGSRKQWRKVCAWPQWQRIVCCRLVFLEAELKSSSCSENCNGRWNRSREKEHLNTNNSDSYLTVRGVAQSWSICLILQTVTILDLDPVRKKRPVEREVWCAALRSS